MSMAISINNALELLQSCIKPLMYSKFAHNAVNVYQVDKVFPWRGISMVFVGFASVSYSSDFACEIHFWFSLQDPLTNMG